MSDKLNSYSIIVDSVERFIKAGLFKYEDCPKLIRLIEDAFDPCFASKAKELARARIETQARNYENACRAMAGLTAKDWPSIENSLPVGDR